MVTLKQLEIILYGYFEFLAFLEFNVFLGFNPCWKETIEFRLRVPELGVVILSIMDKDKRTDDDIVGYSVVLINSLKQGMFVSYTSLITGYNNYLNLLSNFLNHTQGYGHIALYSPDGKLLPTSSIFIHVAFPPDA